MGRVRQRLTHYTLFHIFLKKEKKLFTYNFLKEYFSQNFKM